MTTQLKLGTTAIVYQTADMHALHNAANELADLLMNTDGKESTAIFILLNYVFDRGIEEAREGYRLDLELYEEELRHAFETKFLVTPEQHAQENKDI